MYIYIHFSLTSLLEKAINFLKFPKDFKADTQHLKNQAHELYFSRITEELSSNRKCGRDNATANVLVTTVLITGVNV